MVAHMMMRQDATTMTESIAREHQGWLNERQGAHSKKEFRPGRFRLHSWVSASIRWPGKELCYVRWRPGGAGRGREGHTRGLYLEAGGGEAERDDARRKLAVAG